MIKSPVFDKINVYDEICRREDFLVKKGTINIPQEEIQLQYDYMGKINILSQDFYRKNGRLPKARVRNFGCQMNEHDAEKLAGMLIEMGYELSESDEDKATAADLIIFNTCCVRENAEEKVFGHLGALKAAKRENPDMVIAVCGCMTEQPHVVEEIRKKYKNVDLVFGTQNQHTFPELLFDCIQNKKHIYNTEHLEGRVAEGVPVQRANSIKAWVTIMYGCNNFCSYCIVPYVRGRERSRSSADILQEIKKLEAEGYKEITLLGQNVNSYGLDKDDELNFAGLLDLICRETSIPRIRFMTSHPKDLSDELIDVMAKNPQICRQLHLPVQSGSTRLLGKMNRKYSADKYLEIIDKVRAKIPDIAFSTDIIVGFPGETDEDFEATLKLVEKVRYDMAFTFIYSKRKGTPAAEWEDQVPSEVVKERFDRLLVLQNGIDREINETYMGKKVEVLVEGHSRTNAERFTGRTQGNKIVNFVGDRPCVGEIVTVEIDEVQTWSLGGKLV